MSKKIKTVKTKKINQILDIHISSNVLNQIIFLCTKHSNIEWFGYIIWKFIDDNKKIKILDIYPTALGQVAYVEMSKEIIKKFRTEYIDEIIEKYGPTVKTGIIHSHNSMATTPSMTDYENAIEYLETSTGMVLSVVTNNNLEFSAIAIEKAEVNIKSKIFNYSSKEVIEYDTQFYFSELISDEFMKRYNEMIEIDKMNKAKKAVTKKYKNYNSYNNYGSYHNNIGSYGSYGNYKHSDKKNKQNSRYGNIYGHYNDDIDTGYDINERNEEYTADILATYIKSYFTYSSDSNKQTIIEYIYDRTYESEDLENTAAILADLLSTSNSLNEYIESIKINFIDELNTVFFQTLLEKLSAK